MKVRIEVLAGALAAVFLLAAALAIDYEAKRRIAEKQTTPAVVLFQEFDDETADGRAAAEEKDSESAEKLQIQECRWYYVESVKCDWKMDGSASGIIRQIARDAGINLIISDDVAEISSMRVRFENLTTLEALQRIARDAGGVMEGRQGDYFIMNLRETNVYAPPPPEPIHPEDRVIPRYDKKFAFIKIDGDSHEALKALAQAAGVSLRMSPASLAEEQARLFRKTAAAPSKNRKPTDDRMTTQCRFRRKTPIEAIRIIIDIQQLSLAEIGGAFVVLTKEEMQARYDRKVPIIGSEN